MNDNKKGPRLKTKLNNISLRSLIFLIVLISFCKTSTFAQTLTVNSTELKQTITMIGGDMERSGANLQRAVNKEEIINWYIREMQLNMWRVRYDKRQEYTEGVKNWAFYANDLATMKMIKDANPNIKFFATMKSDYHGYSEDNHNQHSRKVAVGGDHYRLEKRNDPTYSIDGGRNGENQQNVYL